MKRSKDQAFKIKTGEKIGIEYDDNLPLVIIIYLTQLSKNIYGLQTKFGAS